MSDESKSNGSESETSHSLVAGARLKTARESRKLAVDAVAAELNLDAATLRALESNQFDGLGAPVFIKGYLRRYAGIVGEPVEDVLAEFDQLYGTDAPVPVLRREGSRRPRSLPAFQVLAGGVLVALIGGVAWWAFNGAVLKPRTDVATVAPVVADPIPVVEESGIERPPDATGPTETASELTAEEGPETADPSSSDSPASEAVAVLPPLPSADPAPDELEITFRFGDDCWLQLTDGDGRRLYSGTARSGQVRSFSGAPPLSLILGNADAVSIEVDGEPYRIEADDRRGRTARMTISGS